MPVVLTLLTPGEHAMAITTRTDLKALKMGQIERITAEAWQQDAVLTMLDLERLLGVNGAFVRQMPDAYHERFGVLLPTAATVLDMGRTLTHKTIVVEMGLSGMSTQEIARRTYHSREAVDQYLKTFDWPFLLRHFGLPKKLMPNFDTRGVTPHLDGI